MASMWASVASLGKRLIGDPDVTFGYATSMRVVIRDKRLGFLHAFLTLVILIYIFVYQIGFLQQFRKEGGIIGTARMQLQQPTLQYRTPAPAFCLGVNASTATNADQYEFPAPGQYVYTGPFGNDVSDQGQCAFLDARFAVTDPLENGALFLPTRVSVIEELASPLPQCALQGSYDCGWTTLSERLQYVPDPEWFTLFVDHSFSALLGSLSRSSSEMSGYMVDPNGNKIDPCDAYTRRGRVCPSYIAVGRDGLPDIFAVQSLLDAVGINSLDEVGGARGGQANETLRYAGLVILLSISYSNFYLPATFGGSTLLGTNSFNGSRAEYNYRVSIVPNSEFKVEYSTVNGTEIPAPQRTTYNRHGIRIVITQTGRIGVFDMQTMLINLVVGFGLLAAATAVVDFIALSLCPLRALYNQYSSRVTVNMSRILKYLPPHRVREMLAEFKEDEHLVDPVPEGVKKWQREAAELAAQKVALSTALAGGGHHSDRKISVQTSGGDVGAEGGLAAQSNAPMVVRTRNPLNGSSYVVAAVGVPGLAPTSSSSSGTAEAGDSAQHSSYADSYGSGAATMPSAAAEEWKPRYR